MVLDLMRSSPITLLSCLYTPSAEDGGMISHLSLQLAPSLLCVRTTVCESEKLIAIAQAQIECMNRRRAAAHPSLLASSLVIPRDSVLSCELGYLSLDRVSEHMYRIHLVLGTKGTTH